MSALRFVVVAAALVPLACSSEEGGSGGAEVPEFSGLPPTPSAGAPSEPAAPVPPTGVQPVAAGGAAATAPEAQPVDAPLAPSETPPSTDGLSGVGGAAAAGGAPAAAGGAAGTEPAPVAGSGGGPVEAPGPFGPASDLPIPPGAADLPLPTGPAQNLRVLDWAGFTGAVSYTFDDSNQSQFTNYPAIAALDVPMSYYLQTNKDDQGQNDVIWRQILADGNELGNHTRTHQQNGANIGADTDAATQFIESRFGVTVYSMAAPFGDAAYIEVARPRFLFNRGVNGGLVRPNDNTNPLSLPCFIPNENSPAAAFNTQVDMARAAGGWLIPLVHGFTNAAQNEGTFQPVAIDQFTSAVQYAKSLEDMWLDTLLDVGAYWLGQRLITSTTPATNGGTSTWTWTLPDHFPPEQFVRVVVDGGSLTQNGVPLAWDAHGYYEVALDAGSLTLAP